MWLGSARPRSATSFGWSGAIVDEELEKGGGGETMLAGSGRWIGWGGGSLERRDSSVMGWRILGMMTAMIGG